MNKKTTIIGVRCSTEEREQMKKLAHENYKTLSEHIRSVILNNGK